MDREVWRWPYTARIAVHSKWMQGDWVHYYNRFKAWTVALYEAGCLMEVQQDAFFLDFDRWVIHVLGPSSAAPIIQNERLYGHVTSVSQAEPN